jgi:gamma-glutamyltranspeptidase/glutathione hydrolase
MVLLGILEFERGSDASAIVSAPRFHHQYLPDKVQFEENALNLDDLDGLERRGHTLELVDSPWGDMQAVVWDQRREHVSAASDPRGIGKAVVEAKSP